MAVTDTIDPEGSDYSAAVTKVKDAGVDAVFFGGYYEAAGRLASSCATPASRPSSCSVTAEGRRLMTAGGAAAEGAIITCTCAPAEALPKGADFVTAYTEAYDIAPGTYAAEAFDAANFILAAHRRRATPTASRILEYINDHDLPRHHQGRRVRRERRGHAEAVYSFMVKDGKIVGEGEIK